jgi:predicted MFS family arabinose efflux permease
MVECTGTTSTSYHISSIKGIVIRKIDFRPFISSLLPLFMLAHFGHHVVGAMLIPLMPMIRTDLGLSYTEAGVITSAFAITGGICQLPAGYLADRFGPRVMVALGVSGVAITGLLIGLSRSYEFLIVCLVIAAILGGGYHPASTTAISATVAAQHRGRALGLHLIGGTSSFWVVPLLATPIAVAWGWRGSYLVLSLPALILGIVLYALLGRRADTQKVEHRTVNTKSNGAPVRVNWRKILPFLLMSVGAGTMLQSVTAYFSLFAVDYLGVSQPTAALLMAITPAVGLFAAPLGGYLSDRLGGIPILIAVSFLTIPLIFILGIVASVTAFIPILIALGLVNSTRMPTSEAYIAGNIPQQRRSTILGLYFFAGSEIAGLMTPVMGILIDHLGFQSSFTIASIIVAAVAVVCSLFLWVNKRQAIHLIPD